MVLDVFMQNFRFTFYKHDKITFKASPKKIGFKFDVCFV